MAVALKNDLLLRAARGWHGALHRNAHNADM